MGDRNTNSTVSLDRQEVHPGRGESPGGTSQMAGLFIGAGIALSIVLHVWAIWRYRFDADEPHHLHVAWGWSEGLLQYRDVFDNHAPLLHIASAPLFWWIGERADVLTFFRLAMLPFYLLVLMLTLVIARQAGLMQEAGWATLLLAFMPPFFLKTLEYRNDTPWLTGCLAVVALLLSSRRGRLTALASGLALGICVTLSFKTVIVAAALASSAILLCRQGVGKRIAVPLFRLLLYGVAGFVIAPAIVLAYFATQNAVADLIYGTITFNALYTISLWRKLGGLALAISAAALAWVYSGTLDASFEDAAALRRRFLLLFVASYAVVVISFWPIVTARDFLPVYPLIAVLFAGAASRHPWRASAVVAALFLAVMWYGRLWIDQRRFQIELLEDVIRLSHRGELIMDRNGATIFRQRPFRYPLEMIARDLLKSGRLADDIVPMIVSRRCTIAMDSASYPPGDREWIREHFIPMRGTPLRVAGRTLRLKTGETVELEVAIAAEYSIVDEAGIVRGLLDGRPLEGRRFLEPAMHRFVPERDAGIAALIWSPALDRGFSPALPESLSWRRGITNRVKGACDPSVFDARFEDKNAASPISASFYHFSIFNFPFRHSSGTDPTRSATTFPSCRATKPDQQQPPTCRSSSLFHAH